MCGIFGYWDRRREALSADTLSAMARSMVHRGPDDEGVLVAPGVGLGMRRLSIIDLATGHQRCGHRLRPLGQQQHPRGPGQGAEGLGSGQ